MCWQDDKINYIKEEQRKHREKEQEKQKEQKDKNRVHKKYK